MRAALLMFAATAVLAGPAPAAGLPDPALALQQARTATEAAQQALSARYAQVWAALPADQRSGFSAQERRWLATGREHDQRACEATLAAADAADLAAEQCRAAVLQARLQALGTAAVTRVSLAH